MTVDSKTILGVFQIVFWLTPLLMGQTGSLILQLGELAEPHFHQK